MSYGRRRKGRYTDPNKAGTIQTEVASACTGLLLRFFKPILRASPIGNLVDEPYPVCGERAYQVLIAASDTFADMQRYLNSFDYDAVYKVCAAESHPMALPVAIVLEGQPSLTCVQLFDMENEIGRRHALTGSFTAGTPIPSRIVERHVCAGVPGINDQRVYYRKGGRFCDVRSTTGHGNLAGVVSDDRVYDPTTAVLEVSMPLRVPDGKKLFMHRLVSSFRGAGSGTFGLLPEPTNGLYITPTHPDYEKWRKWGIAAYQMEVVYNRWSFEIHRMFTLVNTVGQLKRLFPVVESLITHSETKARLAAAKQLSAMPEGLTFPLNEYETVEEVRTRLCEYYDTLDELASLLTRAVLAPELSQVDTNFVAHFDNRWWCKTEYVSKVTW